MELAYRLFHTAPQILAVPDPASAPLDTASLSPQQLMKDLELTPATEPPVKWQEALAILMISAWTIALPVIPALTLLRHFRFMRRLRATTVSVDEQTQQLWRETCESVGMRREIPIVAFDGVQHPAVAGALNPKLLLPPDITNLGREWLGMIMLHELAHLRRRDLAANWLLLVIRTFHWWNPIYWLAAGRYTALREQACDEFAMRKEAPDRRHQYCELLLKLSTNAASWTGWSVSLPVPFLTILPAMVRQQGFKNRLRAILNARSVQSRSHRIVVAATVIAVSICGLTAAREQEMLVTEEHWTGNSTPLALEVSPNIPEPVDDTPRVTTIYAVSDVLQRMIERNLEQADARNQLLAIVKQFFLEQPQTGTGNFTPDFQEEREHQQEENSVAWIPDQDSLMICASSRQHLGIAGFLDACRLTGLVQVCVECRVITADVDLSRSSGITWMTFGAQDEKRHGSTLDGAKEIPGDSPVQVVAGDENLLPIVTSRLSEGQMIQAMKALQKDRRSNVMFAPKVTVFNGMQGTISSGVHRPFVTGIGLTTDGMPQAKQTVVLDGNTISFRPMVSANLQHIHLRGAIELSRVEDVRTASTSFAGGLRTIQLPHIKGCKVQFDCNLEVDETLLIGVLPTEKKDLYNYMLLTPWLVKE